MRNKYGLELSRAEWEMVIEALDRMIRQTITPESGANPFALMDWMIDALGDFDRVDKSQSMEADDKKEV